MFMEELQNAIENIGAAAGQYGMTAQEFIKFLQQLATIPVKVSENDFLVDEKELYIIPVVEPPAKIVIEDKDVMKIDFDT